MTGREAPGRVSGLLSSGRGAFLAGLLFFGIVEYLSRQDTYQVYSLVVGFEIAAVLVYSLLTGARGGAVFGFSSIFIYTAVYYYLYSSYYSNWYDYLVFPLTTASTLVLFGYLPASGYQKTFKARTFFAGIFGTAILAIFLAVVLLAASTSALRISYLLTEQGFWTHIGTEYGAGFFLGIIACAVAWRWRGAKLPPRGMITGGFGTSVTAAQYAQEVVRLNQASRSGDKAGSTAPPSPPTVVQQATPAQPFAAPSVQQGRVQARGKPGAGRRYRQDDLVMFNNKLMKVVQVRKEGDTWVYDLE